jgi:hypothetical protein
MEGSEYALIFQRWPSIFATYASVKNPEYFAIYDWSAHFGKEDRDLPE